MVGTEAASLPIQWGRAGPAPRPGQRLICTSTQSGKQSLSRTGLPGFAHSVSPLRQEWAYPCPELSRAPPPGCPNLLPNLAPPWGKWSPACSHSLCVGLVVPHLA